jgi:hypothetical protein
VENLFIEYHGSFSENHQLTDILQIVLNKGFHFYIREAAPVFKHPFQQGLGKPLFDIHQIFCFRIK